MKMKASERMAVVADAISQHDHFSEIEPEELLQVIEHAEADLKKADEIAGIVVYIKKRFIERASRIDAFRAAFPRRCVYADNDKNAPYKRVDYEREEISIQAIDIKAKRLEARPIFKKIYALLTTSIYISYAVDRMIVLDEAFKKSHFSLHILGPL